MAEAPWCAGFVNRPFINGHLAQWDLETGSWSRLHETSESSTKTLLRCLRSLINISGHLSTNAMLYFYSNHSPLTGHCMYKRFSHEKWLEICNFSEWTLSLLLLHATDCWAGSPSPVAWQVIDIKGPTDPKEVVRQRSDSALQSLLSDIIVTLQASRFVWLSVSSLGACSWSRAPPGLWGD